MINLSYREVEEYSGVPSWRLKRWIQKGWIKPAISYQPKDGKIGEGFYYSHIFSGPDWIEIQWAREISNPGFGSKKVNLVLKFIRSKGQQLKNEIYQTAGTMIWARGNDINHDTVIDKIEKPKTVFLRWKNIIQLANSRYQPPDVS